MNTSDNLYKLATALDGVPLLGVMPRSPSHRAGLRYGDVILECNGLRTKTIDDYMRAKKLDETGMTVKFFRDGEERTVSLDLSGPPKTHEEVQQWVEERGGLGYIVPSSSSKGEGNTGCN